MQDGEQGQRREGEVERGKGKREMKRTERCGERTEREIREKKKRGIGDAKRGGD